jgi:hypothetical protein
MTTPLDILIRARNAAGPAFTQLQQQMGGVDRAAGIMSGGLGAAFGLLAGGAAVAAIAGTVRELQVLGIQSANTGQAFKGLASDAGESSTEMLAKLRAASRGMITDLDLMTNANRAMMLGVTSNADDMSRLLEVAATRGRALGRSTADAFTDIVTGIGRMSPLILDNLGIVTGGEKAFDAYAETLGKTAAELTDVEKKQFLVNKVLSETQTSAAAATDGVASLGVAWANYKAALGEALLGEGGLGAALARGLQGLAEAQQVQNAFTQAVREFGVDLGEQVFAEMGMAVGETKTFYAALKEVQTQYKQHAITAPEAIAAIEALGRAYLHGSTYAGVMTRAMDEFNKRAKETGSISVAPIQTAYQRLGDAAGITSDTLREMPPIVRDQAVAIRGATGAISTYNQELENLKSTIAGIISASVSGTKGLVDFTESTVGGFDPNGPARDFGRMWDVAVNGFQSQWIDELRSQGLIPDDVIAAGEAALKSFAEGKARAFQSGTDLGLLDTNAIIAQVRQQLTANAEMERVRAEILATLTGQGISRSDASKALGQVLGDGTDAGTSLGADIGTGISTGLNTAGASIAATLKQQIADASDRIIEAGRIIGRGLGDGLLQVFKDNVPAELVSILADLVAPEVLKRINAAKTTSGARP